MSLVRHCVRFALIAGITTALLTGTSVAAQFPSTAAPPPSAAAPPPIDVRLADAAQDRDIQTVRSIVESGADVNAFGSDGTPALHWFIRVDDVETARFLVDAGADATLPNRYGVTPLYLAAANGNSEIIRILLDAGADPNEVDPTGETVLMAAVRVGKPGAVRLLLDRGASVDTRDPNYEQTALMFAVRGGHNEVVQLLVDRGADVAAVTRIGNTPRWVLPNSVPGFSFGIGIVRGGLPERGVRDPISGGLSPLHYAARDNQVEAARILIEAGADLEQTEPNSITPLLMAIGNNQMDTAHFLIEAGADVNVSDWYGRTPLWQAVEVRNMDFDNATLKNYIDREPVLELIKVLLDQGADPNSRSKEAMPIRKHVLRITGTLAWVDFVGQTPFITASLSGDLDVMRMLLEYGADPHIATLEGTTALMAAAGVNWVVDQTADEGPEALLEAVKFCHELGMDLNSVNSMGITALMGAVNRESNDIVQYLVDNGARLDVADNEGRTPLNWAEGVFLATHAAVPKPRSMALIQRLMAESATNAGTGDR